MLLVAARVKWKFEADFLQAKLTPIRTTPWEKETSTKPPDGRLCNSYFRDALHKIQRRHTKRSTGNPRCAAHLFDWTGKKGRSGRSKRPSKPDYSRFAVFGGLPVRRKHRLKSVGDRLGSWRNPAAWRAPHLQSMYERRQVRKIQTLITLFCTNLRLGTPDYTGSPLQVSQPSPNADSSLHSHTCQLLESWNRDTLTWDVMWFRLWSRSDHCEGEALAFLGGPGACSPGKFWKSKLSNKHFLMFRSMILKKKNVLFTPSLRRVRRPCRDTFTARKIGLKYTQSVLRSEGTGRRMNFLTRTMP